MAADTQNLLEELREDHRNMARVLDVLAGIVQSARSGTDPDFELVVEIMRYMTVYPDAVHHPKEDIIYAELKASRPDLAEGLEDVPSEHREIADLGTRLRDEAVAITAGAAVRREHFVDDANRYLEKLRQHMQWEEKDLFRRIDTMLEETPPAPRADEFGHIQDPVFELEVEAAFRRLLTSLRNG